MPTSPWLTRPLRPSSGTHEIMRMTFEVQNGTVHSTNSTVCMRRRAHVEGQKVGDGEAETSVMTQTSRQNLSVDR